MSGRLLVTALVVCFTFTSPSTGLAQADASLENEARALYQAGVSAYDGGRYDEALRYFQMSYEKSGRAELLYNVASAAERVREDELALRSYEDFLEALPNSPMRSRVETRIAALRRQLEPRPGPDPRAAEPASASATPVTTEPRAEAPGEVERRETDGSLELDAAEPSAEQSEKKVVPWVLVGSGAAVAVVGGALMGLGFADKSKVENPSADAYWTDGADAAYDRGPARLTTGVIMLPVGAALAAVGVVLAVKKPKGEDGVAVHVGPGSLQLSGRF
jgi:tetratricopeptide (TPR) repeat protein